MKEALLRIFTVVFMIYLIGFIFFLFTEFVMDKQILDINQSETIIKITMPKGDHIDFELVTDNKNTLEGNLTILDDSQNLIYFTKISKKYTPSKSITSYYSLLSKEKQYCCLLKESKRYTLIFKIKDMTQTVKLLLRWLETGYDTIYNYEPEVLILNI